MHAFATLSGKVGYASVPSFLGQHPHEVAGSFMMLSFMAPCSLECLQYESLPIDTIMMPIENGILDFDWHGS